MKNIISIGYYADFSRFFSILGEELNKLIDSNWINFSIYPSGYIYDVIHGKSSLYLECEIEKYSKYNISDGDLDWICEYHEKSNLIREKAKRYLSFYESYLATNDIDLVILSGDSRMPIRAMIFLLKKHSIKVMYFEQGPLNTTILDCKGVNANCSFRLDDSTSNSTLAYLKAKKEKPKKWSGYKKYRIIDILCQILFSNPVLGKYKYSSKKYKTTNNSYGKYEKYVLLILQVPEDANMICHSPFFNNHYSIVFNVYKSLPNGYKLIVREHPLYKGKYEESLYRFASEKSILIDSDMKLNDAIENSSLVIVNNSTVGLEAMSLNKNILILGDSYYDNERFIYKYKGNELDKLIIEALNENDKKNIAMNRIYYLFENEFITGHFRDLDKRRFNKIVECIYETIK
ncbi:hypothetical protein C9J22_18300 [Photobacterium phosphoreum]|uniref:capsular polysaccharide export protein, LipB/KpsS family n=1 Tax=Photobacterium phosphoreum TaxID=659 RepID=UPI000D178F7C|nr:hypothetical protein [Photobacterium phosphoreum]PSU68068.1 hypothetical protein C9J22_18300 [Photobacterium phosphoreum]